MAYPPLYCQEPGWDPKRHPAGERFKRVDRCNKLPRSGEPSAK